MLELNKRAAKTGDSSRTQKGYPPTSLCLGYGVGTSGVSIVLNTVSVYFPTLMATVLGMSPAIAGTLLMVSKLYDAITDVLIGFASDKMKSRWGRRPFLLLGAVISFISLLMIFAIPIRGETAIIIYMAVALIIYSTGYSLFNVPYLALPAEITRDNRERLKLVSFRTAFIGVGQLTALALSAWLISLGGGGVNGYSLMGVCMALIALGAMLGSYFGVAHARFDKPLNVQQRLRKEDFKTLLDNRPLFVLLGAKLCQYIAFGVMMPVNLLFLLNVMTVGYPGMIHLAVVQNVTLFASMPFWLRVGRRIGKRNAYILAQVFLIPAVLSWYWAGPETGMAGIWWRAFIFGMGSAGALLMSTTILQDAIEYDRLKNKIERGGVFASLYSVNEKIGFAVGAAILGVALSMGGYVPTTDGEIIEQSSSAIRSLYLVKVTAPAVVLLIGCALLFLYNLSEAKLQALREENGVKP